MGIYFSCATMSKSIVVKASPSVTTFSSSLVSPSSVLSLGLGRPFVFVVRPDPAAGTQHTTQQHRHFGYYVYINESKCGRRQTDKRKTEKTRKKTKKEQRERKIMNAKSGSSLSECCAFALAKMLVVCTMYLLWTIRMRMLQCTLRSGLASMLDARCSSTNNVSFVHITFSLLFHFVCALRWHCFGSVHLVFRRSLLGAPLCCCMVDALHVWRRIIKIHSGNLIIILLVLWFSFLIFKLCPPISVVVVAVCFLFSQMSASSSHLCTDDGVIHFQNHLLIRRQYMRQHEEGKRDGERWSMITDCTNEANRRKWGKESRWEFCR